MDYPTYERTKWKNKRNVERQRRERSQPSTRRRPWPTALPRHPTLIYFYFLYLTLSTRPFLVESIKRLGENKYWTDYIDCTTLFNVNNRILLNVQARFWYKLSSRGTCNVAAPVPLEKAPRFRPKLLDSAIVKIVQTKQGGDVDKLQRCK